MDLWGLSSIGGIVAATMVAVEVLKRFVGNRAGWRTVPTWVYACVVSGLLTVGSWHFGILTETGPWYVLVAKAVGMAATASGFWTWLRQPADPIEDSQRAIRARDEALSRPPTAPLIALALIVPLLGATACGPVPKHVARHRLALVSESYADALKRLQAWEISQHRQGLVAEADHQVWQRRFERLANAGKAANDAIRAANLPTVQEQAKAILDIIDELVAEQVIRFSESQRQTAEIILVSLRTAVLVWSATLDSRHLGEPVILDHVLDLSRRLDGAWETN